MKSMKCMLKNMSSVLALTIGLSVFGGGAINADTFIPDPVVYYGISVAGVQVTSLNEDNVLEGDPINDGKVRFDPY